jgi:VWFA-related protein
VKRFGFASFVLLAILAGLSGLAVQAEQQPPATFKSEVGVIEINAVVTDAAGNFVRDLKKDDFQVYEDGRQRSFAFFSLIDMPVLSPARAAARGPESDVRTVAETRNGRVYVLVLDDLHTAPHRAALLKAAARRFIDQYFYPGDLAAIVRTGPGSATGQELTSSRRLLLAAIDRFQGQQIDSAADGRLETARRQESLDDRPNDRLDDPNDAERSFNARRTLNALRDTANWMAGINGRRKSVIFFSEGIDYDIQDVFNSRGASSVLMDARDSIGSATRSNVSIYSIDPRGLAGLSDEFIGLIEPQTSTRVGREQLGTQGIERDLRVAQDSLRMLADETGGLALVNSNDFAGGFERIVRDNSSYYVLGYYSQPDSKGGKFHKIDVRVRRPGLRVRARHGYVTSDVKTSGRETPQNSSASAVLRDALNSPLPAGNLPMSVFAAPFKGDAKQASVVIAAEIPGASLKFQQRDALFADDLEFSLLAVGQNGRIEQTDRGNVSLSVKPDIQQRIAANGVRFLSRMALPPGRYQLRVAAREAGGGAASVVHYDLEVPNFSSAPLAVSGLVITSTSAGAAATTRADAQLQARLPAPPTAARSFAPGDVLTAYAEIYDNVTQSPHRLDIVTTIKPANSDSKVFSHSSEAPASTQSIPYLVEVPLKGLAPGAYVLRIDIQSRLGSGPGVSREVPFTIQGVSQ